MLRIFRCQSGRHVKARGRLSGRTLAGPRDAKHDRHFYVDSSISQVGASSRSIIRFDERNKPCSRSRVPRPGHPAILMFSMRIDLPARRSSVEQMADGLQYRIPPKRDLGMLVFLPLWLVAWGFGEVMAARALIQDSGFPRLFLGAWLAMWTFGGFTALYTWLAQVIGKELITLTPRTLNIKHDVTGFERTREYDLAQVRNLRVLPPPDDRGLFGRQRKRPFDSGAIAFDYGAKTYRFAAGVDESEAAMIIEELKSRYGFLAKAG